MNRFRALAPPIAISRAEWVTSRPRCFSPAPRPSPQVPWLAQSPIHGIAWPDRKTRLARSAAIGVYGLPGDCAPSDGRAGCRDVLMAFDLPPAAPRRFTPWLILLGALTIPLVYIPTVETRF